MKLSAITLLCLSLLAGCGYKAGTLLPSTIRTVYVEPFTNKTTLAGIEASLTNAVIDEIQKQGVLKVVSEKPADAVLKGEIINYRREAIILARNEPTKEYRGILSVDIAFTGISDPAYSIKTPFLEGTTEFYVGSVPRSKVASSSLMSGRERIFGGQTLPEAERNAIPALVENTAEKISTTILEGGW